MKKIIVLCMVLAIGLSLAGMAQAEPRPVPEGTLVTAVLKDGVAQVTISGPLVVKFEQYAWEQPRYFVPKTPGTQTVIPVKVHEGRRFNFKFECDGEWYALVTPEMQVSKPAWLGEGVEAECKSPASRDKGCALLITAR